MTVHKSFDLLHYYLFFLCFFLSILLDIATIKTTTRNPATAASPVKAFCAKFIPLPKTERENRKMFMQIFPGLIYRDFGGLFYIYYILYLLRTTVLFYSGLVYCIVSYSSAFSLKVPAKPTTKCCFHMMAL